MFSAFWPLHSEAVGRILAIGQDLKKEIPD
jgi:hypothetical protein